MCSDSLRRKNDRSSPSLPIVRILFVADTHQPVAGGCTLVRREVVGSGEERMVEEAHPVILKVNLGNRKEIHPWSIPLCGDRG
jgi:hypothetical protein